MGSIDALLAVELEDERNMVVLKALNTKAYKQRVKAQTKGEEPHVSAEDVLEQARATHNRNMLQLSDLEELRRRRKAVTSMVRLQAEDYIVRALDPLLSTDLSGCEDSEDDTEEQTGKSPQRRGALDAQAVGQDCAETPSTPVSGEEMGSGTTRRSAAAEPNLGQRGRLGSVCVAPGSTAAVADAAPAAGVGASGAGVGAGDTGAGEHGAADEEGGPVIVNVLTPSDDEAGDGCETATDNAEAAVGTAPVHQSVDASNSRAESLISQLRHFQKASGSQAPARLRSSVSGVPVEPSVRGGWIGAAEYPVRAGRQLGAVPAVPQRDTSPMPRPLPPAPGSPPHGAAGGAEASFRLGRASTASGGMPAASPLGAGPPRSESPAPTHNSGGGALFQGGPRPPNGRVSAVEPSPRVMLAGLSDRSVRSLRAASTAAVERPLLSNNDSGCVSVASSGGGSGGGNSPVTPAAGALRGVSEKSVHCRTRRASALMVASSHGSITAGGGPTPWPPATDPSARGGWRACATSEISARVGTSCGGGGGGGNGRATPLPGGGESSSAPVAHLPDLFASPVSGTAVALFRAITGAEPVGRPLPPVPPSGEAPEASVKSVRALQAQAQLLQLQQLMGMGMGAAALEGAAQSSRLMHMSSGQVELVSASGPSSTRLPKINSSSASGSAAASGTGPMIKRSATDSGGPSGGASHAGRTQQGAQDDDAGLVSKVKGLFHILKR